MPSIVEEGRTLRKLRLLLTIPLVLSAVLLPGSGRAAAPIVLKGTVGPAFSISLRNASGDTVRRLAPGSYTIQVQDFSSDHNFHLKGPGVDMKTDVDATGSASWDVTLSIGTYTYVCDAHPNTMRGSLAVGNAPAPTPKLSGRVGPKRTISLRTAAGALVKALPAGTYTIVVRDATKRDNFHLLGKGVNRKTGVRFRGRVTWKKVTFTVGSRYTIRSDAHRKLRRTFRVLTAPPPPPPPARVG